MVTQTQAPELPQDIYAEQALLGSLLIDSRLISEVTIQPEDFFLVKHQYIYEAMLAIHKRGEEVDDIVLIDQLQRNGTLVNLGGPAEITHLMNSTPATIHFREYAAIVRSRAKQRKVLHLSSEMAQSAINGSPADTARIAAQISKLLAPDTDSDPLADMSKFIYHADDLAKLPRLKWLIPGEIPERGSVVVFGPSGVGKSFFVVDRALSLAQDHIVVYLAAEGESGFAARVEAWKHHHKKGAGHLYFFLNVVSLIEPHELDQFIKVIKPIMPDILIVDTMSLCMLPGDENSTRDMGLLMKSCKKIRMELGCATLLVHHTGKEGRTERGNSALRGTSDVMIRLLGNDDQIVVECSKTKDAAAFDSWYATLMKVNTGEFESAVFMKADKMIRSESDPLSTLQRLALETLAQTVYQSGASWGDILAGTLISHGSLQRIMSRLIELKLVESQGRPATYTITDKGRKKLNVDSVDSVDSGDSRSKKSKGVVIPPESTESTESGNDDDDDPPVMIQATFKGR